MFDLFIFRLARAILVPYFEPSTASVTRGDRVYLCLYTSLFLIEYSFCKYPQTSICILPE